RQDCLRWRRVRRFGSALEGDWTGGSASVSRIGILRQNYCPSTSSVSVAGGTRSRRGKAGIILGTLCPDRIADTGVTTRGATATGARSIVNNSCATTKGMQEKQIAAL